MRGGGHLGPTGSCVLGLPTHAACCLQDHDHVLRQAVAETLSDPSQIELYFRDQYKKVFRLVRCILLSVRQTNNRRFTSLGRSSTASVSWLSQYFPVRKNNHEEMIEENGQSDNEWDFLRGFSEIRLKNLTQFLRYLRNGQM